MKALAIAAALLLSGCANIQPHQDWVNPPGFTCDPSGACWPTDVAVNIPYRLATMTPSQIRKAHSGTKEAAELHDEGRQAIAFAITNLPYPIIAMPTHLSSKLLSCGWTMELLRGHEEHHLNETTVHDMIGRTC